MNVYFDLNMVENCCLQITGTTQNFNEYLPNDAIDYNTLGRFKYKDTYTVNIIKYISTKNVNILKTIITSHLNSEGIELSEDKTYFQLSKDGHYVIEHLIIPDKNFIDSLANQILYNCLYATDGDKFYKKIPNEEWQECDINDIITSEFEKTTISKAIQDTFSICILNREYLKLCKSQFCKLMQNSCLNIKESHNFELDLLWMGINAIKYNVELGNLFQAQSLLEEIISCTGISLLHKSIINKKINDDCGCL